MSGRPNGLKKCPDGARPTGWARNAPAMGRADACRAALRPGGNLSDWRGAK